jgi:hypothetical protein
MVRRTLASPYCFPVAMAAYVGAALAVDQRVDAAGQVALGITTWLFLFLACRDLGAEDRARAAAVVLVATCGEILGSLVLGLYTYRLHNLPTFVPPGHGLFYLTGLQLSRSALVRRHARKLKGFVLGAGGCWALAGVTVTQRADVAGALCMLALAFFVLRGRAPLLYSCMFVVVSLLELYGTAMGTWRWAEVWPHYGLASGNPPSGISAGYVLFDAAALALGPALLALWQRGRLRRAPQPST